MLQRQQVPIRFAGGVDTKTDSKLVIPGKLTALENGVFINAETIDKRFGYTQLTNNILGGGTITDSNKLTTFNNELVTITDSNLYSFSQEADAWVAKGTNRIANVDVNSKAIASSQDAYGTQNSDSAVNQGLKVFAWVEAGDEVYASVQDITTGTFIVSRASMGTSTSQTFRCAKSGNYLFVLWLDAPDIKYKKIDVTNPTAFSAVTTLVAGNVYTSGVALLDVDSNGTEFIIMYRNIAPDAAVVQSVDSTGTITATFPVVGSTNITSLSVCRDVTNGQIFGFVARTGVGVQYFVLSAGFINTLALTTVDASVAPLAQRLSSVGTSANNVTLFWDYYITYVAPLDAMNDYEINKATVTAAGVVTSVTPIIRGVGLTSKPFLYNSVVYVLSYSTKGTQATYFLIDQNGSIIAKSSLNSASGTFLLPNIDEESSGVYKVSQNVRYKFQASGSTFFSLANVSEIEFNFISSLGQNSLNINENLHVTGGFLRMYDGSNVVEHNFHTYPETIVLQQGAGGSLLDGVYSYYVTYEWTDREGNVHKSTPGVQTITIAGGGGTASVTVTVPTLRLTDKSGVVIMIYRTTVNGTIVYRLPILSSLFPTMPLVNDTTVEYLQFADTFPDSQLLSQPTLYTTGDVLENVVAPACKTIEFYKNRVILAGLEDETTIWYSKYNVYGEGVAFTDAFTIRVDDVPGPVYFTKTLDDKLVIFKEDYIFYMSGDGPLDTGLENNFTIPQLIASDVGCKYPNSCVSTPLGLMFKSNKGIYLLTRSLQIQYIGAEVEAYNTQDIVSAILLDKRNQVVFLTSSGSTLVYDYVFAQWSTFTNHAGYDATISQNSYYYLRTNGRVWKQDETVWTDNGSEVSLKVATAWLKVADVQGYQRVQRFAILGNYYSAHTLTVKLGYNYKSTYDTTLTFNTTTGLPVGDTVYQFRGVVERQKSEAIRFEIYDTAIGAPGRGFALNNLMLQVGVKTGLMKLRQEKSI